MQGNEQTTMQEDDNREADLQEREWSAGAVTSFTKDWDNEADAIYDNWKEHYHGRHHPCPREKRNARTA